MIKKIVLLLALIILATVSTGCAEGIADDEDVDRINEFPDMIKIYLNGMGETVYKVSGEHETVRPDPRTELPLEARQHLDKLGGMEFAGAFSAPLGDSEYRTVTFYNDILYPVAYYTGKTEWKLGGLTSLISLLFDNGFLTRNAEALQNFNALDRLMEQGEYEVYVYISQQKDFSFGENKGCMIVIEKGTESLAEPHMYIWSYDRIYGISHAGLLIPSDDKIYEYYKEFGDNDEEPELYINTYPVDLS